MKIRPAGTELFQAYGRNKHITKLTVAFRNFCEKRLRK